MRDFWSRHRILLCVELLGILVCWAFCFRPEEPVFSVDGEAISRKMEADGSCDYYRSEEFALSPGVYRLEVRGGDHEGIWYPTVSTEESSFQALRCNGASVFAHQRETKIEVYVVDPVDKAFVACNYIGETGQAIEAVTLIRTGIGWRMLTFILLLAATGVNLLVWMRQALTEGRMLREQEIVVWVLGFCVLLAYLPYTTDYFSTGADGAFHLLRIEGLKETLLGGRQFPVRIQEYWLYGHGYAVSSFYGDLFLLFPVMLRVIGFNLMDAYKLFMLAVLVGTALTSYYSFYKCTGDRYGALLGSVLYQLAPYHIYNFYNRSAVGEYLGMMFLPLVLCGFCQIYMGDSRQAGYLRAKLPLIAGISGILQSHILTCEMTVAGLLVTAAVLWRKTFQKEILKELFKAALLCILINAWFWVPLLKMLSVDKYALGDIVSQDIRHMGTRLAGILQMYPYMGGGQTGMYNGEPIQAGAAFWAVLLCCLALRLCRPRRGRDNPYDRVMGVGAILSLAALFLSTRYFPWDMAADIPGIGILATAIQFPTRLLAVSTLFFAFTASFFVPWLRAEGKAWTSPPGDAVRAGCVIAVSTIAVWSAAFHVNDISYNMRPIRLYTAQNMGSASVVNGEYLLAGEQQGEASPAPISEVAGMGFHDPAADPGLVWTEYVKEGLEVRLFVENRTEEELYVELPLTGYRGYDMETAPGTALPYITEERGAHGDLRIAVPAGYSGRIHVSYKGFAVFRAAEAVSLLTLLLWAGLALRRRFGGRKETVHG